MGLFGPEKMILTLERGDYKPGDIIKGTITLKLKKPTMARKLEVAFIGEKLETHSHIDIDAHGSSHPRTTSEYVTLYDFKIQLGGEKEYLEGTYSFEIKIPEDLAKFMPTPTDPGHDYKNYLENVGINPDGKAGKALAFMKTHPNMSSLVKTPKPPLKWYVNAQLDIPLRLDVKDSQQIIISQ